jgi:hypothetical protein
MDLVEGNMAKVIKLKQQRLMKKNESYH